eukprot:TRINITY_DN1434_c0_g1_i2.p1 TRINITY_DN1434_c0_g1~~TRINITY_DN1434_c0_g1_i2.p1  ORF type:complete len:107 (-),score=8.11 TRINITY_DN1434_c0_g1_i2:364-684(-)
MLGRAINRSVRRRKTLYNKSISLDKNMNMGVSQLYRWTSTQNNLGKFPTIKHADNSSTNQDPSKKQFSYMVMGVTAAGLCFFFCFFLPFLDVCFVGFVGFLIVVNR